MTDTCTLCSARNKAIEMLQVPIFDKNSGEILLCPNVCPGLGEAQTWNPIDLALRTSS